MSEIVLAKDISAMAKSGSRTEFVHFKDGSLTYRVYNPVTDGWYRFDIPIEEAKGGTFPAFEKVIYHARWIRKAIQTKCFRREH
jgi:hypothetical protein